MNKPAVNTINIRYFAALQEQAQITAETLTTDLQNYGELYQELANRYGFLLPLSQIRVAVNDQFVTLNDPIINNAQVVFIPPVAGG